jgi:serine/threonine protein kinase
MSQVLCGRCYENTQRDNRCAHCGEAPFVQDVWALIEMLGHGATGYTWKAEHLRDGRIAAIKELSFRKLTDFKQLELFQREAETLKELDHPGIPSYEDDFVVDDETHVSFYLVQELIEGRALSTEVRVDEAEIARLLVEMADILEYLQARRPPVVHRDIKPSNIMRRPDGSYVLIDFGSMRAAVGSATGGSTVAGTLGYMAPEQLLGRAGGASDIYGLGATALALLAGKDGHEVVDARQPGAWRDRVEMSRPMEHLLTRMLRVDEKERLSDPAKLRKSVERRVLKQAIKAQEDATPESADLAKVEAALNPDKDKRSARAYLIKLGRDPFKFENAYGPLFGITMITYMLLFFGGLTLSASIDMDSMPLPDIPAPYLLVGVPPVMGILFYAALAGAGMFLDRENTEDASIKKLLRFRGARAYARTWLRCANWTRIVTVGILIVFVLIASAVMFFTLIFQWADTFAIAVVSLIVLDQIQALILHKNGWRMALYPEFKEVWPEKTDARKMFKKLASGLWYCMPHWRASAHVHQDFGNRVKAFSRFRELDLSPMQREHVDLVDLVINAHSGLEEKVDASLALIDAMTPRRATVKALGAAMDIADETELAEKIARVYIEHRACAR